MVEKYTFKTEDGKEVEVKPNLDKNQDGIDTMTIVVNDCQVTGEIIVPNLNIEERRNR